MKICCLSKSLFILACAVGINLSYAASAHADRVCRACPFDCAGIGAKHRDCKDLDRHYGQCCVDLDDRGQEALEEADYENTYGSNSRRNDPGAYDDQNGYQPGDCPRGFHVNDRNCTKDEKRRGCRDLRSPSGEICVGWNR